MRSQRRSGRTVVLVAVVKTRSDVGDSTETETPTTVHGAIFEPERPLERTGDSRATVVRPAMWNLPGVHELDADDLVKDGDVTWQVLGGSTVWLDRTEVPVVRVTNV